MIQIKTVRFVSPNIFIITKLFNKNTIQIINNIMIMLVISIKQYSNIFL